METQTNGRAMKVVYTVIERAPGKTFWTRVGVGSVNRDGSLGLRLDAIPISGILQVRDWEPRDDAPGTAKAIEPPRARSKELNPEPLF